jgi:hypothetical protein
MHPLMTLAFVLLAAIGLAHLSYFASAPDALLAEAGPAPNADAATPNHDAHRVAREQRPAMVAAATPNDVAPMPSLNPVALRAEPEPAVPSPVAPAAGPSPSADGQSPAAPPPAAQSPAVPSAPDFVDADTTLYAKGNARLRAAPSTKADIVTKLAADAPLRATARSADSAWWQVSLADGRTGYVHRIAVSKDRLATKTLPPAPARAATSQAAQAPVTAAARQQPAPLEPESTWRSQGQNLLGYVDKTMDWLVEKAGSGSPPKVIRTER